MNALRLPAPIDAHLHLRDGPVLTDVLRHTAMQFGRAVVMPNLRPPVATTAAALAYRDRILAALPAGRDFTPLMTLYLTDTTCADEIARARQSGAVLGVKLYPAGATTHAEQGIVGFERLAPVFEAMQAHDLPLLVHGEVADPQVDPFDREAVFIERHLAAWVREYPRLRIVLEHVSTRAGVEFVRAAPARVAATLTAHHLLLNRGALFAGGIQPHHYCLPLLKREQDRLALVAAATSGDPKFFLGTDSAPHARGAKESACGCAGIYTAHAALALYAEVFERAGALDRLPAFAGAHAAAFYGLPAAADAVQLIREPWTVPESYPFGAERLVPLMAGQTLNWRVVAREHRLADDARGGHTAN